MSRCPSIYWLSWYQKRCLVAHQYTGLVIIDKIVLFRCPVVDMSRIKVVQENILILNIVYDLLFLLNLMPYKVLEFRGYN
ncbi:hypothetical protein DICPUDRAFT_159227 [Dictyostelium purpureum]|uniref:Uncharacterized protein n=1 Tax=Dictyostelium purpureum TaxID=5786 RepID=F1A3L3_DICPU|nr:uncharacterized protein DICPUDRAFT_159227 [Dictyostelium purpureum]EGC29220.1 hypothetical protein DICPUDRAFT_159227 [Dictyostelium purpureum]|eukprot:XP_003294256.1 hypothetical protein DICPUDRAFT_159227 [Dictyostelium purpureum]